MKIAFISVVAFLLIPIHAFSSDSVIIMNRILGSAASGGGDQAFSDDFSSDTITSGAWIEDADDWNIGGGTCNSETPTTPGGWLRYATQTNGVTQYISITLTDIDTEDDYRQALQYGQGGGAELHQR